MTRIAIIIPSLGRRRVVARLAEILDAQTRPPDRICFTVCTMEDAPPPSSSANREVIVSKIGSCAQRNAGLDHIGAEADIVVFFDDDFVPASDYMQNLERFFHDNPAIAGATGVVVRDGVKGPGLTFNDAFAALERHRMAPRVPADYEARRPSLYGCNMAFRRAAIGRIRFDERLPLYGWLEDVDFSAQAGKWGPLVKTGKLAGVHLGVKGGRTSGVRFGYSQIANPIYLHRKGTMTIHHAADNIGRNLLSNHIKAIAPERHVDRRGRVKGNWMAIADLLRGRVTPERIIDF